MRRFMQAFRYALISCCLVAIANPVVADVRLPKIFADSMVIQQKRPVSVWGWAEPDEEVSVSFGDQTVTGKAGQDGRWLVWLEAMAASADPQTLQVQGANTVTIRDVLIGEVWICSGQSNMNYRVRNALNPEQDIAAADYPQIRQFAVSRTVAQIPQDDCNGQWTVCSPDVVADFTAVGYFFGRKLHRQLEVPIGLIHTSWGGTQVEAWTSRAALASDVDFHPIFVRSETFRPNNPNQASVLYNGMLHPLIPYAIRGAIWYQGEANVARAQQYAELFPTMIQDWRNQWGQGDFPFLYVQLAPYRYRHDPQACAELWEAQLKTLQLPNTGMAVTTDIGNVDDIHPSNKQEVGRRLALWALGNTYGKDVDVSGPIFDHYTIEGDQIRIYFEYADEGLQSADGQPISYLQIAGPNGQFQPAQGTIEGSTLLVRSDAVTRPVAVRFGWQHDAEPNLVDAHGLPASPFRTDNFKMVTDGAR